jgi:hypothetical protein
MAHAAEPGTLLISLDFELHWGVRDLVTDRDRYAGNLLGAREAIPRMLALFERFGVHATWATVGFLFARDQDELRSFFPTLLPSYRNAELSPYHERVGRNEVDDPLHYAPSLIDDIRAVPGQEIATHTFSHYYCMEDGQTKDQFAADLETAARVANDRGLALRSLVFPRNQVNAEYLDVVRDVGLTSFRGNATAWPYAITGGGPDPALRRSARLADAYLPLTAERTYTLSEARSACGLLNLRASHFLRSSVGRGADDLQLRRVGSDMETAARHGRVFHLWWHPHNFGARVDDNCRMLEAVLERFQSLRQSTGFRSLSMGELATYATEAA